MRRTSAHTALTLASVAVLSLLTCVPADAQVPDAVGVRAQGMAGAFTAIADDATATWWNPAGLATGAYLNLNVEYGQSRPAAADDVGHGSVAIAFPALGLSYYRMTVSQIQPTSSTGSTGAGRQDTGTLNVHSVELSQFGASFGQSIGNHFVFASTLRYVHGGGDSEGDLDIGAMASAGALRAGVMVRNIREVDVPVGDVQLVLKRQVRAGVALNSAARSSIGGITVAFDTDILDVPTAVGDERRFAVGGEFWTKGRMIGVRGGFSASAIGESRTTGSGGASFAVRRGIYAEGQLTGGSDRTRKGWAAALRVTF
jgi:hypothetical protein